MPDAVTTILDALALVAVAVGVGVVAAATLYGLLVGFHHPVWLATGTGVAAGGAVLGIGSWQAGRSGGRA